MSTSPEDAPLAERSSGTKTWVTSADVARTVLPGLFVGFLAGLVGLGGAEERMPFLLYGLGIPVYEMIVANLIISFFTSGTNFVLRAQVGLLTPESLQVALTMVAGSVPGAYIGALVSHKISVRKLKGVIAVVLSVVLAKILSDALLGTPSASSILPDAVTLPLAFALALVVGMVAGAIGVAGGEYRIPLLVYVFGFSIKLSGTISQLVSVPTVLVALYRHSRFGLPGRRSLSLAALMGASSVAGVFMSTYVLVNVDENVIRLVFGAILGYTILRILRELGQKNGTPGPAA